MYTIFVFIILAVGSVGSKGAKRRQLAGWFGGAACLPMISAQLEFTSRLNCLTSGWQIKLGIPGYGIFLHLGYDLSLVGRVTFSWLRPGYYPLAGRGCNFWGDTRFYDSKKNSVLLLFFKLVDLCLKVFGQFLWYWRSGRGFLNWNGIEIIPKYGLEVDFWIFWEAIICATTFLLVNDVFKTN